MTTLEGVIKDALKNQRTLEEYYIVLDTSVLKNEKDKMRRQGLEERGHCADRVREELLKNCRILNTYPCLFSSEVIDEYEKLYAAIYKETKHAKKLRKKNKNRKGNGRCNNRDIRDRRVSTTLIKAENETTIAKRLLKKMKSLRLEDQIPKEKSSLVDEYYNKLRESYLAYVFENHFVGKKDSEGKLIIPCNDLMIYSKALVLSQIPVYVSVITRDKDFITIKKASNTLRELDKTRLGVYRF